MRPAIADNAVRHPPPPPAMRARPVALAALALLALIAAGCGDAYQQGAGVYTITTSSTTTPHADRARRAAAGAHA